MRYLRGFSSFLYGFVIGDDPLIAAAVAAALALTAAVAGTGVPAWWILPATVAGILSVSLHRATRP